jgi:hypothetical protein
MSCLWTILLSSSVPKPANAITICIYYLVQHPNTIKPMQRIWKESVPSLDQGRIATKREEQDWHQQERWLPWHVNFERFHVQSASLICDPTIVKDPARTPAKVSISDLKITSFQIM